MELAAVRRIDIQATSSGVAQATAALDKLGQAHDGISLASSKTERATLSLEKSYEKIVRRFDATARSEQDLARIERDLDRARAQGLVSLGRQNELMELARVRVLGLSASNDNAAASQMRLAVASREALAGLTPIGGVAGGIVRALGPVGLAIGAVALASNQIASAGDQWTRYGNQLQAAGVSSGNLSATQRDLADLAMTTRSSLEATVALYSRMTRASSELGVSQTDVRRVTEILGKELATAGLSAGEAAGGLLQFSQGLQAGRFNGDELRSVLENLPGIARAIAKEFGTTVGGLREMGAAGELSSERVFRAVLKAGKGIDEAFGKSLPTAAQAMENLGTASTRVFAEVDKRLGISQNRAQAIVELAQAMSFIAGKLENAGAPDISGTVAQLTNSIKQAQDSVQFFTMRGMTADADQARASLAGLEAQLRTVQGAADAAAQAAATAASGIGDVGRQAKIAEGAVAGFSQALRSIQGGIPDVAKVLTAQKDLAELSTLTAQASEKSRMAMAAETLDRNDAAAALGRHTARMKELTEAGEARRKEIIGTTAIEKQFGDTLRTTTIAGLEGEAKGIATARAAYEDRKKTIEDSIKLGATEAEVSKARADNERILTQELKNVAAANKAKGGSAASSTGTDAFDTALQRTRDQIEELKLQAEVANKATVEVYALTEAHRLRRAAMSAGRADEEGISETIKKESRALADQRVVTEASIAANRRLKESFDFVGDSFKSLAEDLLTGSDGINGALKSLGKNFLSQSLDALIKGGGTLADVTDAENSDLGALLGIAPAKPAGANDNERDQHFHDAEGGSHDHGRRGLSVRRDHVCRRSKSASHRASANGDRSARAEHPDAIAC